MKIKWNRFTSERGIFPKLTKKHITDEEYQHAQDVYTKLNCQSFYDYHVAYLQCDVLLLSDIFENFRKICLDYYELDPLNYISAPGMAWDALLLKTKIELELISDPKILDIVERMKRGGG